MELDGIGAWDSGSMRYTFEIDNSVYTNGWYTGSGTTYSLDVPSSYIPWGSTLYIAPTNGSKAYDLTLKSGSFLWIYFLNNGSPIEGLMDILSWSFRPGGHQIQTIVFDEQAAIRIMDDISVDPDYNVLICNPVLYINGELFASFYIYV